ncbi:general secretion pathway protein GspK [Limisalsivibrio acetivorans]|uniref:general secretion pathway protein GspK n=1 Tax=Limisalsivibrio acetivorans TaxID=1304888 RepID=UPI0003B51CF3|nr:type II secretion system protein GspK [Limisalsivibrio acetivorans]
MIRNERGSAIIFVLVIALIALSVSAYMLRSAKDVLLTAEMLRDKIHAKFEAESIPELLAFITATAKFEKNYFHFEGDLRKIPVDNETYYLDGRENTMLDSKVEMLDTGAMLPLWAFDHSSISKLFYNEFEPSKASIMYSSLIDWKDADDLHQMNGAESHYYNFEKKLPYTPRNRFDIQAVEELRLIRGFDNETYDKVKDNLIVALGGRLNVSTAPPEIIGVMFNLSKREVDYLKGVKKEKGEITLADIEDVTGAGTVMTEVVNEYPSYSVVVDVYTEKGKAAERLRTIMSFKPTRDKPYKILRWEN